MQTTTQGMTATEVIDHLVQRCARLVAETNGPAEKLGQDRFDALVLDTFEAALPVFLERFKAHNGPAKTAALKAQFLAEFQQNH